MSRRWPQLRRQLREAGGEYKVYKNTLVRFAARDLGLEIEDLLTGPTAIAFVDGDPVNVAKALRDFARTNPALVVKGGLLGDRRCRRPRRRPWPTSSPARCCWPSSPVPWRRPMAQFAGLLQALPRNFAYGLKALIDQQGGVPERRRADAEAAGAEPAADAAPEAAAPPTRPRPTEADRADAEADAAAEADTDRDRPRPTTGRPRRRRHHRRGELTMATLPRTRSSTPSPA